MTKTEEFIQKAKLVHGDKYDYSKVEYINAKTKVIIICPVHGEFEQTPNKHLNKHGCNYCGGTVKSTTEEFIQKAKIIHGDKYNYSKVEYIDSKTKVTIICPEHGEFLQTPSEHLNGRNCSKCVGGVKITQEEFIEKAKEIHGDKYDYSKVEYINAKTKVIIICPVHGEFEQRPSEHLNGRNCSKCVGGVKITQEEFIEKAKEIHGDKYDYSLVNYVNSQTKIIIICPEHGEFKQRPNKHLMGRNCSKCVGGVKITQEEFVEKAKQKHNDKYDYSKVNYINNSTNVIIICPEHGEFEQRPASHLRGSGCSNCVGKGFTYLSFEDAKNFVRILGIRTRDEYLKWWEENKPIFLPRNLEQYYKNNF